VVHLRVCRTCGHVGATAKHYHATRHPIIESYDPPEGWGWRHGDELMFAKGAVSLGLFLGSVNEFRQQTHKSDKPQRTLGVVSYKRVCSRISKPNYSPRE